MGEEIERKFVVNVPEWSRPQKGRVLRQGYLSRVADREVRVRLADGRGFMTVKSGTGKVRKEYEWEIPAGDAEELLEVCEPGLVEKVRYEETFAGRGWEIDVFGGHNEGLVLAEVELGSGDEAVELPPWIEREVTGDAAYSNASLSRLPP